MTGTKVGGLRLPLTEAREGIQEVIRKELEMLEKI